MRTIIYTALALGLLTGSVLAQPRIEIGPGGVGVETDRDHDRYRDRDRDRRRERVREHDYREDGRNCKTVTVEENGVTRRTRRCY